jgi:acyl-CoA thioesterase-1
MEGSHERTPFRLPAAVHLLLAWAFALFLTPALAASPPVLVVVGDSLSAAYGMETARGWVALLQARAAERGWPHRVVNASISGDTTRGGRSRLAGVLERHRPAVVVIELGGNDGLRGIPPEESERNLEAMVQEAQGAGARVLLVGIRLPPNYGPAFAERFGAAFGNVATRQGVPLVPFLLEGVGGNPELMLEDGIHPRAEAQPRLLENVWPYLEPLLAEPGRGSLPAAREERPLLYARPSLPSPAVLPGTASVHDPRPSGTPAAGLTGVGGYARVGSL